MNGPMIFSSLLVLGLACASPQRRPLPEDRLGAIPFPVVRENVEKSKYQDSDKTFELKCKNDHGICDGYCHGLGYTGGGCIADVCYCHSDDHATLECDRIVPIGKKGISEKRKSCKTHCRLLNKQYVEGECIAGKCYCR